VSTYNKRVESSVTVLFKNGSRFESTRMSESEADTLYQSLLPGKSGNESIKEVQLYVYEIEETVTFMRRHPFLGA